VCFTEDGAAEKLIRAGRIASEARRRGLEICEAGTSVLDAVEEIEALIVKRGGKPAFPVNIGIDSVAAHYTPSSGDTQRFPRTGILKVDVGVHVDGFVADTAATKSLGGGMDTLVEAPRIALENAMGFLRPGGSTNTIGSAIEQAIRGLGYRPISNLTGHSIERYNLHAGFSVYNVGGMEERKIPDEIVLAVEPFATDGEGYVLSGKQGNIFSLNTGTRAGTQELEEFAHIIETRYNSLPFAERWLSDIGGWKHKLSSLLRKGVLHGYEILIEAGRGRVSQWEHTLIVSPSSVTVTTL